MNFIIQILFDKNQKSSQGDLKMPAPVLIKPPPMPCWCLNMKFKRTQYTHIDCSLQKKNKDTLKNITNEEHRRIFNSGDSSLAISVELPSWVCTSNGEQRAINYAYKLLFEHRNS